MRLLVSFVPLVTNHSSAANFSTSVPTQFPISSSLSPRDCPTTIPTAPLQVNDQHSGGHSPRDHDMRNFNHPQPESRCHQPDLNPSKRRSVSIEVHNRLVSIIHGEISHTSFPPLSPRSSVAPSGSNRRGHKEFSNQTRCPARSTQLTKSAALKCYRPGKRWLSPASSTLVFVTKDRETPSTTATASQ